jgi:hypothetical protein
VKTETVGPSSPILDSAQFLSAYQIQSTLFEMPKNDMPTLGLSKSIPFFVSNPIAKSEQLRPTTRIGYFARLLSTKAMITRAVAPSDSQIHTQKSMLSIFYDLSNVFTESQRLVMSISQSD